MARTITLTCVLGSVLMLPLCVLAQNDTLSKASAKDTVPKVVFSGYVDAYYAYYTDSVGDGNFQQFPTVSPRSGFGLNVAMVSARYDGKKYRGVIALQYGDIPKSAWSPDFNNILEAHAGLRLCKKLWLDAGFFRTHFGTEALYPKENLASSITVDTWHEPFYECGMRLDYAPTDKLTIDLYVLNGYNLYVDNNAKKSVGLLATYALGDHGNIGYSNYIGDDTPTAADSISHLRFENNLFLNYTIKKLTMQAGVDYCTQQNSNLSLVPDVSGAAYSALLTLKYACTKHFAVVAREEWFDDPEGFLDGVRTDKNGYATGLNLTGTTIGAEYKPTPDSYLRLEGRQLITDPDQEIFRWDNENTNVRFEAMLNLGVSF